MIGYCFISNHKCYASPQICTYICSSILFNFSFDNFFQRGEIVQWINQGGGEVISGQAKQIVHYTVECHGVTPMLAGDSKSLYVSSHWIRSCLEVSLTSLTVLDFPSQLYFKMLLIFCIFQVLVGLKFLI